MDVSVSMAALSLLAASIARLSEADGRLGGEGLWSDDGFMNVPLGKLDIVSTPGIISSFLLKLSTESLRSE